jgi:hypothetical protein
MKERLGSVGDSLHNVQKVFTQGPSRLKIVI